MMPKHFLLVGCGFLACIFWAVLMRGLLSEVTLAEGADETFTAIFLAVVLGAFATLIAALLWSVIILSLQLVWLRRDYRDDPIAVARMDAAVMRYRAQEQAREFDRLDALLDEFLATTKRAPR